MTKQAHREDATTPRSPERKKPYRTPRLVEYGDLRKITLKAGTMGDGTGLPATRK
jgi:hypothetical protein